jgi:hypothetical protein
VALLRRLLRAAREQPGVAIAAAMVFLAAMAGTTALVVATGPDGNSVTTPTSTITPTTAPTTTVPATTVAPTTTVAPATTVATTTTNASTLRCVVRLHGKGARGAAPYTAAGVTYLTPEGNADAGPLWNGGRQWLYFPNGRYNEARTIVASAIADAGCGRVIIDGFSNGAAFAAKLYCRGETFDNRVVGVVIDDPVVDSAVNGCGPASGVDATLYWTGGLEAIAQPGWDCTKLDWTCEGGRTIGIGAYEGALGTDAKQSKFSDHQWYQDAREVTAF